MRGTPVRRALRLVCWALLAWLGLSLLLVAPLRWLPPPTSSFMLQRSLQERWNGREDPIYYRWVDFERLSPHLGLAVVAAEDQKFPGHPGFDFASIRQALADRAAGRPLRGASTISQQVAKNLYLWPGRSMLRKAIEAWFTLWIELLWPKQRILEMYLNVAEFGERTYGAEAASLRYFGRPAANLSAAEAALLAAVLPSPRRYRVEAPSARVRRRQDWILRQMRQLGGIAYLDGL